MLAVVDAGQSKQREDHVDIFLSKDKHVQNSPCLLNDNKYGSGNRSHWALSRIRFPNLIRALNTETNMNTRKRVSSLYHRLVS